MRTQRSRRTRRVDSRVSGSWDSVARVCYMQHGSTCTIVYGLGGLSQPRTDHGPLWRLLPPLRPCSRWSWSWRSDTQAETGRELGRGRRGRGRNCKGIGVRRCCGRGHTKGYRSSPELGLQRFKCCRAAGAGLQRFKCRRAAGAGLQRFKCRRAAGAGAGAAGVAGLWIPYAFPPPKLHDPRMGRE